MDGWPPAPLTCCEIPAPPFRALDASHKQRLMLGQCLVWAGCSYFPFFALTSKMCSVMPAHTYTASHFHSNLFLAVSMQKFWNRMISSKMPVMWIFSNGKFSPVSAKLRSIGSHCLFSVLNTTQGLPSTFLKVCTYRPKQIIIPVVIGDVLFIVTLPNGN